MTKLPIVIDVEIPNNPDKIYDYTKHILELILGHIDLDLSHQRRIKLIVVELITNSIKHANEHPTQIQLIIDHPQLSILKLDKGLQIEFSSPQQIPFENIEQTLKISFSESNNHEIQPLDEYRFRFLNPIHDSELSLDKMPEHFGFYIITLASDSFIYQYDPEIKENRFIVSIKV